MAWRENVLMASKGPSPQSELKTVGPWQSSYTSPHINLLHVQSFACTFIPHM